MELVSETAWVMFCTRPPAQTNKWVLRAIVSGLNLLQKKNLFLVHMKMSHRLPGTLVLWGYPFYCYMAVTFMKFSSVKQNLSPQILIFHSMIHLVAWRCFEYIDFLLSSLHDMFSSLGFSVPVHPPALTRLSFPHHPTSLFSEYSVEWSVALLSYSILPWSL